MNVTVHHAVTPDRCGTFRVNMLKYIVLSAICARDYAIAIVEDCGGSWNLNVVKIAEMRSTRKSFRGTIPRLERCSQNFGV